MIITKEYLKSVQPKTKGKSDKYSWNIYRYLKKHRSEDIRVFVGLIIGHEYPDGVSGLHLNQLMASTRIQEFWFSDKWNLKEITGWLSEYQRVGRCLLIPHDFVWCEGEDTRFTYVNNTRKCNWCGLWQHRELHKVVEREIKEEWRDDK